MQTTHVSLVGLTRIRESACKQHMFSSIGWFAQAAKVLANRCYKGPQKCMQTTHASSVSLTSRPKCLQVDVTRVRKSTSKQHMFHRLDWPVGLSACKWMLLGGPKCMQTIHASSVGLTSRPKCLQIDVTRPPKCMQTTHVSSVGLTSRPKCLQINVTRAPKVHANNTCFICWFDQWA